MKDGSFRVFYITLQLHSTVTVVQIITAAVFYITKAVHRSPPYKEREEKRGRKRFAEAENKPKS